MDGWMYVCMYACMYACMYICMYVCMYIYTYVCMYLCMFVYIFVCLFVCHMTAILVIYIFEIINSFISINVTVKEIFGVCVLFINYDVVWINYFCPKVIRLGAEIIIWILTKKRASEGK